MTELEYPFDAHLLMRRRDALKKELLAGEGLVDKRIAVLGGSTTSDIVDMLELFLLDQGIRPTFYESDYARFWEDAVFGNEALDAFCPDVVFVHTTSRNILSWPEPDMDDAAVDSLFEETAARFEAMWGKLADKFHCPVVQNNFECLPYRLLGNLDAVDVRGRTCFVNRLNARVSEWARSHDGFFVNDINWQASDFGLSRWHDPFCWYMYKYALSSEAVPVLAFNVSNIVKSLFGFNKKAVALDLDGTLWGGVVGEDGPDGVELGQETAIGQAFSDFQRYLGGLRRRGVLLGVVSKNDDALAKEALARPEMVLKSCDFASVKANWRPKGENLVEMAKELSLLPESFVFVDDNPAEREIVRRQVPGCAVPEMPAVEKYIAAIDRGGYFEATKISKDDLTRGEMYRANAERARRRASFEDYGEYLESLEMRAEIKPFEPSCLDRVAQLVNKTNQFNLTSRRCTREEIARMAGDAGFLTRCGRLTDRFGDNGMVAVSVGEVKGDVCELALLLLSCRVLGRGMELAMVDEIARAAIARGVRRIRGTYRPTSKNAMVRDFYATMGFAKVAEDAQGNSTWELDVSGGYAGRNKHIEVV